MERAAVLVHARRFAVGVAVELVQVVRQTVVRVVHQGQVGIVGGEADGAALHLRSRMQPRPEDEPAVDEAVGCTVPTLGGEQWYAGSVRNQIAAMKKHKCTIFVVK